MNERSIVAVELREIEDASLRAWPAIEEEDFDGWTLRFSEGFTGRANSVRAPGASNRPFRDRVAHCEQWYEQRGRPCLFRLSSLSESGLDAFLADSGYVLLSPTHVLHRAADGLDPRDGGLELRQTALHDWLRAYARFTGHPAAPAPMARIIERIGGGAFLGTLWGAGRPGPAACGLAVLDGALLGLFDLVVASDLRRRGLGGELVRLLVGWGRGRGATDVYLQVAEDNAAALGLYERLGFETAYDYWYRIGP